MTLNCCSSCFNQSPLVCPSPWDHCGSNKLVNRQKNILKSIGTNKQRVVVVRMRLLLQTKKRKSSILSSMHKPNQKDSDNDNEEIEQLDNSDKEEDYDD
jgi:hypothetical protein